MSGRFRFCTILFLPLLCASSKSADASTIDVLANNVKCGPYTYATKSGSVSVDTYCTTKDLQSGPRHYLANFLKRQSRGRSARQIHLSTYVLDNAAVINEICDLISAQTNSITLVTESGLSDYGQRRLKSCAEDRGGKYSFLGVRGQAGDTLVFHNKHIIIEYDDGQHITVLSTGNPTIGSENYIDAYISFSENDYSHPMFDYYACVQSVFTSSRWRDVYEFYAPELSSCRFDSSIQDRVFQFPIDRQEFIAKFAFLLGRSKAVSIMVQSFNAPILRDVLLTAVNNGVSVRMLRDDDLFYISQYPKNDYMNSVEEFDSVYVPLEEAGVEQRFVRTNHHLSPKNFVHGKVAIFELIDGRTVSLFGSLNFTQAGIYKNFENMIYLDDPSVNRELTEWFDSYWKRGMSSAEMPTEDLVPKQRRESSE